MKPYLLLDIDGVFNPFGWGFNPEGFVMHTVEVKTGEGKRNVKVFASQDNRKRLAKLAEYFQFVWATTWEDNANAHRLELFGLEDELEVISFSHPIDYQGIKVIFDEDGKYIEPEDATYKLPYINKWSEDKIFAWVDDVLGDDVKRWADSREYPTLLIQTECNTGLTDQHVDQIIEFARAQG